MANMIERTLASLASQLKISAAPQDPSVHAASFLPGAPLPAAPVLWDTHPQIIREPVAIAGDYRPHVPWGEDDTLPDRLNRAMQANPLLAAALEFKASLLYGDGVVPAKRHLENDRWQVTPCYEWGEINQFLEENEVNTCLMECAHDMVVLNNAFIEIELNHTRDRIIGLRHLEATYSRWETANPKTGQVEHHFFSNQWGRGERVTPRATPALPRQRPLQALKRIPQRQRAPRYVMGVWVPTVGKPYYAKPNWASIIESGWLEYANAIPTYKTALLRNGMQIRYIVQIRSDFWDRLFQQQGARSDQERKRAKGEWLAQLDAFLKEKENSGKSLIVEASQFGEGIEPYIKIIPLRNDTQGGELLPDLEEASNILAYGMGVHPSLIGSAPGKSKTINGTEARELFIIKQRLMQPVREQLLAPLKLIRAFNGWPQQAHFVIQNLELTTLDKHTGAVRTISQPAVE